jgi:hypothetical protein
MEHMVQQVRQSCGSEPWCVMAGGAGWKMAPSMSIPFELVDSKFLMACWKSHTAVNSSANAALCSYAICVSAYSKQSIIGSG